VMLHCPALGRLLAPEEVSAALLRELADRARRHLDADLTGAVRGGFPHPCCGIAVLSTARPLLVEVMDSPSRGPQSVVLTCQTRHSANVGPACLSMLMPALHSSAGRV